MTLEDKQQTADSILQLIIFRLGNEEFGVEITRVKEIIRMQEITHVPKAPSFLEGVINLRGKIIPIVDLRTRLGWKPRERDAKTRIIVVESGGHPAGFIVDAVTEVLRIPEKTTELPSTLSTDVNRNFITAIGIVEDRLILLLDLDKVLSLTEKEQLKETVKA